MNEINSRASSNQVRRLLDKVLMTRIPRFSQARDDDEKLIKKQLKSYISDYEAHREWEKKYCSLDAELNEKIYSMYGLNETEIKHVEENSRPSGWHVD